jgi:uncharacterized protein YeaO (DUF488 family)
VLRLKRAYEPGVRSDGRRILVDRLWPRGLSKEKAAIEEWMKEIAPPTQRRYRRELRARNHLVRRIAELASRGRVTLVFGARDEAHNDAVVLAAVVRARMKRATATTRGDARYR